MQRIIVKNFGPLKDIDLEIKDYMIFLGPQASGKSTLAKLIYGFKEVIWVGLLDITFWKTSIINNKIIVQLNLQEWEFYLKKYFFSVFKNYKKYVVQFQYDKSIAVVLTENDGIIEVKFNKAFFEKFSSLASEIQNDIQSTILDFDPLIIEQKNRLESIVRNKVQIKIKEFFHIENGLLFVPDERNINRVERNSLFIINVKGYKDYFIEGFKTVETGIRNTVKVFDAEKFSIIKEHFYNILKGEFEYVNDGRISLFDGTKVSLDLASSGQKEIIGILIILTIEILEKSRDFYVIEEPEAHLFPEAQKDITYLISLLANQEGNQVIITTHSHYILGALNILINAHRIGQISPEEVEKIVPRELWVDKNRIFAGFLENGIIKDIYDDEAEMIKIQQLNAVAGEINKDFDRLLDLEFTNENV